MATLTIPVGTQPVVKSGPIPATLTAGEALDMLIPVYKKSNDQKHYAGNSVATTRETSQLVGVTVSVAELNSQVSVAAGKGTVVDFGVALTKGASYYLVGAGLIGLYSDITVGHQVVRVGVANEDQDLIIDLFDYNEVKS